MLLTQNFKVFITIFKTNLSFAYVQARENSFFFIFIHYSIFFIRKKWTVFVKAYDVSSSRVRNIYTSDQEVKIARSFCYSTYLIFAVLGFVCAFSPSLAFPRYFFTSGNSFTNYIQFLLLKYICVKNYQFISADFL